MHLISVWANDRVECHLHIHQQHCSVGDRELLDPRPISNLLPDLDRQHG